MEKSQKNIKILWFFAVVCSILLTACAQQSRTAHGPSTPPPSPSPDCHSGDCSLDDLSGATEPANLWQRVVAGYDLTDHAPHPRVREAFEYYRQRPAFLKAVTERAEPYLHFIVEEIAKRDMPMEFALLPAIESSFDPFAYSHGRAAGLWQFVPITARHMQLRHSWWYDGRRDVISSTRAALDYLLEQYQRFDGDWLLAMAAYNSGASTVNRAIRRNRAAGRDTDYWSLSLPEETEAYIPKLIGLSQLLKRAEYEDIEIPTLANAPSFAVVETGGQIDLAQAAALAGITIEEIYKLNPGFNRWATDPNGPHRLAIPIDKREQFELALAEVPGGERLHWVRYAVEPGDNLISIARRFNTDVATIKASNSLGGNLIRVGQTLMLPSASKAKSHYSLSAEQRLKSAQRSGEADNRESHYHTVEHGESLWVIARRYGVGVRDLAAWNDMVPKDPLYPGRELIIWKEQQKVALANADSREVIRHVPYTVRSGDSLARIAQRFSVRVRDIVKWNEIDTSDYLMPGDVLSLYVDVTQLSGR